ncbi:MAG: GNAT family N-acetyltransferase [Anaerolineae bacterium]|nr:GNAT family N-acetyltransferase [Anaerolineae bacterium]
MERRACLRDAHHADAAGMAQVQVAAWQVAYRGLLPDSTLDRLTVEAAEKQWRERLSDPAGEYLVLADTGRVAGFVGYGPAHDEDVDPQQVGEIYMLYVAPEQWRQGYGIALVREAVARLGGKGATEIVLWVLHNNEPAIAFYQAAGFVADGARQVKQRRDGTQMLLARYRRQAVNR